jgi:hypothetical protein
LSGGGITVRVLSSEVALVTALRPRALASWTGISGSLEAFFVSVEAILDPGARPLAALAGILLAPEGISAFTAGFLPSPAGILASTEGFFAFPVGIFVSPAGVFVALAR